MITPRKKPTPININKFKQSQKEEDNWLLLSESFDKQFLNITPEQAALEDEKDICLMIKQMLRPHRPRVQKSFVMGLYHYGLINPAQTSQLIDQLKLAGA